MMENKTMRESTEKDRDGTKIRINKKSPMPIYYQVYELIKEDIRERELKEGEKLPSEAEYMLRFGTSRVTLRKSLELLEEERIITRSQGRGSFVNKIEKPIIHDFSLPTTQNERMQQSNIDFERKLVRLHQTDPSPVIRRSLKMNAGDRLYYMARIFYYEGRPISYNESWMRAVYVEDLEKHFVPPYNLTETLLNHYNIKVNRIQNTISAALPKEQEVEHLSIDYGTPLIVLTSLSMINDEEPFEYSRTSWISSRMRFIINSDN